MCSTHTSTSPIFAPLLTAALNLSSSHFLSLFLQYHSSDDPLSHPLQPRHAARPPRRISSRRTRRARRPLERMALEHTPIHARHRRSCWATVRVPYVGHKPGRAGGAEGDGREDLGAWRAWRARVGGEGVWRGAL